MSFTNQKPFIVEEHSLHNFTNKGRKRFGCALCSKEFKVGDTARWVYCNGINGLNCGNFFVCETHDTHDVLDKAKESFLAARAASKQWGIYGPDWIKDI